MPANQKVSIGLSPTANTMIHRTQFGRPSTVLRFLLVRTEGHVARVMVNNA
jgi:hypothetical protein